MDTEHRRGPLLPSRPAHPGPPLPRPQPRPAQPGPPLPRVWHKGAHEPADVHPWMAVRDADGDRWHYMHGANPRPRWTLSGVAARRRGHRGALSWPWRALCDSLGPLTEVTDGLITTPTVPTEAQREAAAARLREHGLGGQFFWLYDGFIEDLFALHRSPDHDR